VQMFLAPGKVLMVENCLTHMQLRVWLYLVLNCDWGNWVRISQRQVSRDLAIDKGNLSRTMQVLLGAGLVVRDAPVEGRVWRYRIPTIYAHYGPLEELEWRQRRDRSQILNGQLSVPSLHKGGRSASSVRGAGGS